MTVRVSSDVQDALHQGHPVVALETAVLTAGLPKKPLENFTDTLLPWFDSSEPTHLSAASAMSSAAEALDVLPVWICVIEGELIIGATSAELEQLSEQTSQTKVSLSSIASVMREGISAGTTVATTLLACKHPSLNKPIRTFATGGIGGLHSDWMQSFDISADITAMATTPTCVVASGAKSILDIPATIQALETVGVPILGYNTSQFPRFIEQSIDASSAVHHCNNAHEIASITRMHWEELQLTSAVLTTNPVEEKYALPYGSMQEVLKRGESAWHVAELQSNLRTPFMLDF